MRGCTVVLQEVIVEGRCTAANFINTVLWNTSSKLPTSTKSFGSNCFAGKLVVQKLTLIRYQKTMSLVAEILCGPVYRQKKTGSIMVPRNTQRQESTLWIPWALWRAEARWSWFHLGLRTNREEDTHSEHSSTSNPNTINSCTIQCLKQECLRGS